MKKVGNNKSKPIRILQIGMHDQIGGIETFVMNHYRNINRDKVQFDFISIHQKMCFEDEVKMLGGKVYHLPSPKEHPMKYYIQIKKIIQNHDYDIVHIHMRSAANILPLLAARHAHAQTILHSHNIDTPKSLIKKILHNVNRPITRRADFLFACSQEAGKWMFGKKNFLVMPNAINIAQFKFDTNKRQTFRQQHNIPESAFVIGQAGRFVEEKNQLFSLQVFNNFLKNHKNAYLVLAGKGKTMSKIQEVAKDLGIEERVIFTNTILDLSKFYSAIDAFIMPSLFEGVGIVSIEAQAANLPCIVSSNTPNEVSVGGDVSFIGINQEDIPKWASHLLQYVGLGYKNRLKKSSIDTLYNIQSATKELAQNYISIHNSRTITNKPKHKITVAEVVGEFCGGGVESCLYNYIKRLKREDYNFIFITHGSPNLQIVHQFEELGCTFYQVTPKSQNLVKNIRSLWTIFHKEKPDIVHCHISHSNYAPLCVAAFCKVKMRISHSHDFRPSKGVLRRLEGLLISLFATHFVACGKDAGEYLYDKQDFQILRNATELQRFAYNNEVRKHLRKELGIQKDEIVVGNIGRLHQQKNQLFLLDIFHHFNKKHPNSKLLIIGEGPLKATIINKAKQLGIDGSLILISNQTNIQDYYQAIDLMLMPSNYEGLPFVLIEAQLSGLPSIVSSTVTTEAKINDRVVFIDLRESPKRWADTAFQIYTAHPKRCSYVTAAKEAGYDIATQTKQLDALYKSIFSTAHKEQTNSQTMSHDIQSILFSKAFIFFTLFIFLKPMCFWYYPKLNSYLNALMMLTGAIISIDYFHISIKTRHISTLQKSILAFCAAIGLSTLLGTKDFTTFVKLYGTWFILSAYIELCIKHAKERLLSVLNIFCIVIILIQFLTIIIFPNGMHGSTPEFPVYFLGYDNSTALTILLGAMYCFFYGYYTRRQIYKTVSYGIVIISAAIFFKTWSATGIVGSILLLIFCICLHGNNKYPKIFNLRNYFIVFSIILLGIVFLRLQNLLAPIIQDILHKDLSLSGRTAIWDRVIIQLKKHPFLGTGIYDFDTRMSIMCIYHAHCALLQIMLEGGILGLLTYLNIYRIVWNKLKQHLNHKTVNIMSFAFCIFLAISLTDVYKNSQLLYIFLVLAYYSELLCHECQQAKNTLLRKILVVLPGTLPLPATRGGAVETLTEAYINENEKSKKYTFDVYSAHDKTAAKKSNEYKCAAFYYIPTNHIFFIISRYLRSFSRKILHLRVSRAIDTFITNNILSSNNDYDLVIVENDPETAYTLSRHFKKRVILHLHNDTLNRQTPCGKKMLQSYRSVYAVSNYVRKRVIAISPNEKYKVHLLMNGVRLSKSTEADSPTLRSDIRKKYGCMKNDIVILYNGRICADKGVYELVQAFNIVHKTNPNTKLLIVGGSFFDGSKKTEYVKKVQQIAAQSKNSIRFTGYIPHKDIMSVYIAADIQVVPSVCNDSCPLTVLEGLYAGLPQIVTRSGGIPEEVSVENAIIINRPIAIKELAQAIEQLVSNPQQRHIMSEASRQRSKQFTEKCYIENFYSLLEHDLETSTQNNNKQEDDND